MTTYPLVIAPAAKTDLRDIYQHGLRQWGSAQSGRYIEAISKSLWSLTEQPLMGTERPELLPGLRSLPSRNHILFYRFTANQIQVIRVLHGRQDPEHHIKPVAD